MFLSIDHHFLSEVRCIQMLGVSRGTEVLGIQNIGLACVPCRFYLTSGHGERNAIPDSSTQGRNG